IFTDVEALVGRVPRQGVLQGDFLREERLASPGTSGGLNALLEPSKRAMSIEADSAAGVAGYLESGNFVDVIVTIRPDEKIAGSARWATDTILEGVKVLA
ncbi:MAG: Flp pilus assembly protein CpaB, partial [Myxococcota bacterium]|nr:Flp pilus assembly protein CpaB [Myxococcota bacterium]